MTYNPPDPHLHINWLDKPLAQCINCGQHPAQYQSQSRPGAKLLWCTHCDKQPPTPTNKRCPGCKTHTHLRPCQPDCRTDPYYQD